MAEEPVAARPPEPAERERLAVLAEAVRLASREGRLPLLADLGQEFSPEEPGRLAELLKMAWPAEISAEKPADLTVLTQGDRTYLYSEEFMTGRYAETAAQAAAGDHLATIAAAVRFDSRTYPRPTSVVLFRYEPFSLTPEEVEDAVRAMSGVPEYADIQAVRASDGSLFLYSSDHLVADLAQGLAEWEAVGQFTSP
ncbi:MAG: hypothetical protein ACM3UP_00875 [Methanocella sp.]